MINPSRYSSVSTSCPVVWDRDSTPSFTKAGTADNHCFVCMAKVVLEYTKTMKISCCISRPAEVKANNIGSSKHCHLPRQTVGAK